MVIGRSSVGSLGCVIGALALVGCAAQGGDDTPVASEQALEAPPELMVAPFEDPEGIAAVGDGEVRRTISSSDQYEQVFGHALPEGVSLRGRRTALFYSAGVKPTGGYTAEITKVAVQGRTLLVTTQLTSPGPNCIVTEALTHPYALATLRLPWYVSRVRFEQAADVITDCSEPPASCDTTQCPEGQRCEMKPVACLVDPCPEAPACVSDNGRCGGFAGIACPGKLQCVDDPADDCDPNNGGADCGGLCQCVENVLCPRNQKFDSSDDVCACVPDECAAVDCAQGSRCEIQDGKPACVADGPACGGIAGIKCAGAGRCIDNPTDDCDPNNGGADCGGVCLCDALGKCQEGNIWDDSPEVCGCVVDPCIATTCETGSSCEVQDGQAVCVPQVDACAAVRCAAGSRCEVQDGAAVCVANGPFCGGIAAFECPGAGQCVDNPTDACDPNNGGADCGGVCVCNSLGLCQPGYVWDESPDVCGCVLEHPCIATTCEAGSACEEQDGKAVCVPQQNPCAAVLCEVNSTCEVQDGQGVCVPVAPENPCNLTDCPSGATCEVHDGAAVCVSSGSMPCGTTTCGEGKVCCNASCGICTDVGEFCIQIACE